MTIETHHDTELNVRVDDTGKVEFWYFCNTCKAGGDPHPTQFETALAAERHRADPENEKEWA